jgi:metal-dependent amidase/aminoacylase/carboxypeptidase family protein
LVTLFRDNVAALGLEMALATGNERMGSSDMGNVSEVVPAIHPYISIGPEDLVGHTPEFREAAGSAAGSEGLIQAAKGLAMTAADLLAEPANLRRAKQAFREQQEGERN